MRQLTFINVFLPVVLEVGNDEYSVVMDCCSVPCLFLVMFCYSLCLYCLFLNLT